jgi:hypothetical protein
MGKKREYIMHFPPYTFLVLKLKKFLNLGYNFEQKNSPFLNNNKEDLFCEDKK